MREIERPRKHAGVLGLNPSTFCERRTEHRQSNSGRKLDACLRGTVKLRRAHGGCLGDERRRRTWTAAISSGKPLAGVDPEISEWDNPRREYLPARGEYIAAR